MLVEYVKENDYAEFQDPSYHRYRGINLLAKVDGRTDGKLNSYIAPCYKQVR